MPTCITCPFVLNLTEEKRHILCTYAWVRLFQSVWAIQNLNWKKIFFLFFMCLVWYRYWQAFTSNRPVFQESWGSLNILAAFHQDALFKIWRYLNLCLPWSLLPFTLPVRDAPLRLSSLQTCPRKVTVFSSCLFTPAKTNFFIYEPMCPWDPDNCLAFMIFYAK